MSTPISKELSDEIIAGARCMYNEDQNCGYVAGATAYAHYKERCDELERWKSETDELLSPLLDYGQSKEANIPLGMSVTAVILERAKAFEQAKKALEEIKKAISIGSNWHADRIATEALASWKEEGKDQNEKTEHDGRK